MKRLIIASTVIALGLAALAIWGNQLLGRTLDAQLGPLLTRQLGLPVQLAPITAKALQLRAHSPRLVMGDPQDPAVVATGVDVTLAWSDLLHGEIRLVDVSGTDLMVRPSRWPRSVNPLPDNYRFLDPWLPRTLQLESGQYVSEGGDSYPLKQLRWQRQADGGATANWSETRGTKELALGATLKSLLDLLQLDPLELDLAVEVAGKPDSAIAAKARIAPGTTSAYTLQIDIQAADMTAHIAASSQTAWHLPEESTTTIPLLEARSLGALIKRYTESGARDEHVSRLDAAVPHLQLPSHRGHVDIAEIRLKDEVGKESAFDFTSGDTGLQISGLTSKGPTGILSGALDILSDAQGWAVNVDATMQAREGNGSITAQFPESDWLWRTGRAKLSGKGNTWDALLNSLQGDVSLAGHHRGETETPVSIEAQLDNAPGEFALERVAITLGDGQLSGSVALSNSAPYTLSADLKGARLDLGFLFSAADEKPLPGVPLPTYLGILPSLDLNLTVSVEGLQTPALDLGEARATLERTADGGKLVATARGMHYGTLDLTLQASTPLDEPDDFQLTAQFAELDIPAMFRQQSLFYSRTSGSMNFESRGQGMKQIFSAMRGKSELTVELRADNDWQRTPVALEKLAFSGRSHLVLNNDRIVGVAIEKLDIDSIEQDLTGNISLVAGRDPWLIADLQSEKLNLPSLMAMLPKSAEQADDADLLQSLKRLGAAQASLEVDSLTLSSTTLSDLQLEIVSGPEVIAVNKLDFATEDGKLQSQGNISWDKERAKLEISAELADIDIDQFLIRSKDVKPVAVSGSARFLSEGSRVAELLGNMTGHIDLAADEPKPGDPPQGRRKLSMKATPLPDGMQAEISILQWEESELSGSVRYRRTTPPSLDITFDGGTLSLLPWEEAHLKEHNKDVKKSAGAALGDAARASADFLGNLLLTPLRLLSSEDEGAPGKKLFSKDPLPLDSLKSIDLTLAGELDSLRSTEIAAQQLDFTGKLKNGQLGLKVSSGQFSGGTAKVELDLDSNAVPATFKVTSTFANVRGLTNKNTFPRSGFISLDSRGQSEAEVAANTSGLVYIELGKGPFDYANSTLLTADIANTVFTTLIPGIDRQKPEMQCGVTVAVFQDGIGATPYGFAARTNQANLLGHTKIDLGKETLQMSLDSRGRKGVGISVGSIFSNTIQIKGPLTSPGIVPDATGLAWRGVAAFMTGGLSVLGESMFKRVLAADNPCTSIKKIIGKELCPTNPIAASSEMVCPKP